MRCGLAPEHEEFAAEIRQLIVSYYRVLFTVEEDRVHILHVRRDRQNILQPEE